MALSFEARRMNNGVTLEQIAQETKISVRMLQAIESGEFGRLPGGIYSTAYIRQYARLAGFDESDVLEMYEKYLVSKLPPEGETPNGQSRFHRLSTVSD